MKGSCSAEETAFQPHGEALSFTGSMSACRECLTCCLAACSNEDNQYGKNRFVPILAFSYTVWSCYGRGNGGVILTAKGETGTVHSWGEWGPPWLSAAPCAVLDPSESN